jgi:hypothetical protein
MIFNISVNPAVISILYIYFLFFFYNFKNFICEVTDALHRYLFFSLKSYVNDFEYSFLLFPAKNSIVVFF